MEYIWMVIITLVLLLLIWRVFSITQDLRGKIKEVEEALKNNIEKLNERMWKLENPPKFKIGEFVWTSSINFSSIRYKINKIIFFNNGYMYGPTIGWKYTLINCENNSVVESYENEFTNKKPIK